MPNHLVFSKGSPAEDTYLSLGQQARNSLDSVLDYIRDMPFPHGDTIVSVFMPPVVVYYYNDDMWEIVFGMSYLPSEQVFRIGIHAITPK